MDENKKKIYIRSHVISSQEEVPIPPPPGVTSQFRTLEEWLINICDNDHPQKEISEYRFLLFESKENNVLCLAGYNTYTEQDLDGARIDFKPSDMFFPLPKEEYQNLTFEQVRERLLNKLIDFTKTSIFQKSFLATGKSITTNFTGQFWPNRNR